MTGKFFTFGLALLLPLSADASVIKQRPFDYSFEVAAAKGSDVFVVCSNSPDDRFSVLPTPPRLAVRLSQNEGLVEGSRKSAPSIQDVRKECVKCLLGTVHFPFDSAEITKNERAKLDELIRGISAGATVNLEGYTCDLGTYDHNMGLSIRRARGVAAYLKGKGISVGKVEGMGKCCPGSDDKRLNRRVEISTQKKEEK